ncbi:protocadherin Fat 4-like [Mya arenaria]|uniref:protocadherin Fat 4-like n=1 Tax=Mya arenaria TaxID=6604 RepID=UPI0022E64898|nr:protocadherin Fat 4-like [Mya arenaria]
MIVLVEQLDRETQSSFTLFIKAYQTDKPTEKVNFTTVHINVVDVDDHLPKMSKDIYNVSIMENSQPGTIVAVLSATDPDLGANGAFQFKYDFKSLNNTSYLNCNESTGLITVGSKLLDREEIEKITIDVYAYRLNNPTRKSNLSRVAIWIEDENDNSPNISGQLNYSILKTLGVGQNITKLDVSDPDAGSNGKVNVTLESTDVPFDILSNEIDIRVARSMNETFKKVYHLLVKAEDQAEIQSERRISFVEVTINVKDVNIHEPDVNVTSLVDLTEELPINSVVTDFEASDKDPDDHITCTVGGTSSDKFKIEDYTVVTTAVLDREVDTEYNISVNCNDTKYVTSEPISVKLLDVNDNVPQFEKATYFFEIEESKNETIGTVHATDDDFGNNSKINYFLETGSQWRQNISVGLFNGQITTRHPLDREVLASGTNVSFLVFAKDSGSPSLENQTLVIVKVLDINDNPPMFNSPNKTINITEKTPLNLLTSIYNAKAVDPDNGENGTVVYNIGGRDSSRFSINNTTGSIGVKNELTITNCTDPYLKFIVIAKDTGSPPKSAQQDVTINIKDINDHAPEFVTGLSLEPVAEPGIKGVPFNYTVNGTRLGDGDVIATDDDCDEAFRTLHFWMKVSDGRFHMDNTTGVISLRPAATLDHDPPQNDNNITFKVFVSDGIHVVSKTIQLEVTNIIFDVKPRFTQDRYNCFVNETLDWKEEDCCVEILYPESNSTLIDLFKFFTRDPRFNFTVKHGKACLRVSALDYEELGLSPVIINITAYIPGVKNVLSRSSIAINILNVNDETPMFESAYYNFSIYEAQEVRTLIGVLGANDPDGDEKLTTAIVNGIKDFDMDGWKLLSKRTFDFENVSERMFIVNVSVSDGRHVNYTSVEVNVKPVNEYPPVVNISSTTFVKENEQLVIPFKVTDEDDGKDGNVECFLFAPKWISIELRGCSNITLPGVDFEQLGNHTVLELMLEARDQGNPSLDTVVNFTVTVEAVNDNVPYFREKYINVSVPEGPIHQCLYVARAYDKDVSVGSEIQFSIRKEDPNITVSKNGSVCLNGDFWITADNNGKISFEIIVDNTVPYKLKNNSSLTSDNQTVTVNLLDINNRKPAFDHPVYNISVNECKKGGLNLTRVHATDADETPAFNTVHYSMVPSNVSGHFSIDSSSGDVVLVKPVDFDTLPPNNNPLVIEVHAGDGAANHSDTATVRVTVLGCNDNRPSFTKEWYNCSVHERDRNLTCNVTAIDADRDQPVNLTYSIVGNKQGFYIDNHNGKIFINSTQLDFETRQRYDLNVSVHDGNFISYATVFVVVINDNDAKPSFTGLPYQLEVLENRYVKVLQVQVADIDSSENTLKYYINDTQSDCKANDFFFLNNTAVLYVNHSNAESYRSGGGKCRLLIYVTDGQDNDTADVNVTILDENEFAPEIVSNGTLTLNDTTTVLTTVLEVDVTDADLTHSNFSYFLHNSDGHFEIDKNTGNVTLVKSIRNEAQAYNFTVVVLDSGSPPRDSMKTFNVAVVDVNEPPVLNELPMPIYVQQHTIANTTVFVVSATDPDIDDANKHMIFTLKDPNGYFAITENGSVYVNRTLDTKVNISLEIRVTDAGGLFHANNYTVVVPYMNTTNINKTWPENEIGNIDLISLGSSSFKLQQSAYSGFFVMHDNGSVSITTSFDREELESVSITVFGYDEHRVIVLNLTVYIEITDMNDCPPKLSDTYQFSVDDDTPLGTMFAEIVASDGDGLPENRNVSYTSTDIEGFYLFSNGSLAVGNITYGKSVYIFNVTASDGSNEETAIVEIAIVDTNDHSPVFGNNSYTFKFMENINGTVAHVDATDIDSAQNGNISYYIFAGDSKGHFKMKGNVLSVQSTLDREDTAVYNLAIAAVDHAAHNPRTGMCTVTVIVEDDNDNAPTFNSGQPVGYIKENAANSSMVQMNQTIYATDIDNGSNGTSGIIYRLNGNNTFKINGATGIITVQGPLDREETPEYNITITAVDSYGNTSYSRSSSIDIIIYVQDVNDNRPNFTKSLYTFNVIENSTVFTLAGNVTAVDVDESSQNNVRYDIVDGDGESFYIDRYNGSLFVVGKLNKNEYELNIPLLMENTLILQRCS